MMIARRTKNSFFNKNLFLLFVGCVFTLVADLALAVDVIINQPTTISETDQSYEFSSLVVDGVEVVINGAHHFQNLTIINGGVISHELGGRLELDVVDTLEINQSSINVNGKGLLADEFSALYSGGSHAGLGGSPSASFVGFAYGDYQQPTTAGRGGRGGSLLIDDSTSNRGGGIIKIKTATLKMNRGSITASGEGQYTNEACGCGGGAGGSIWIDATKILTIADNSDYSANSITANGAFGSGGYFDPLAENTWVYSGNGGGGRVSVSYSSQETYTLDGGGQEEYSLNNEPDFKFLRIEAGIDYQYDSHNYYGAAGTAFIVNKTTLAKKLTIGSKDFIGYDDSDYEVNGRVYAYTPLASVPSDVKLNIGVAKVRIAQAVANFEIKQSTSSVLIFAEDVLVNKLQSLEDVASIDLPDDPDDYLPSPSACLNIKFKKNATFAIALPCGAISVSGQLAVVNNEVLAKRLLLTLGVSQTYSFDTIELRDNSSIRSSLAIDAASTPLVLIADDIKIDKTSKVDVSGAGISIAFAEGQYSGGFGHGGHGAIDPAHAGAEWAETYGEYDSPLSFGRGRSNYGAAGGALKIIATNLELNGHISASASYGHGSGGSIWLDVDTISVTDPLSTGGIRISADANGSVNGGGRVALHYKVLSGFDPQTQISAYGYAAGTIYTKRKESAESGVLTIRNDSEISNNLFSNISLKNSSDKIIIENSNINFNGLTSLDAILSLKNAKARFPEDITAATLPIVENVEWFFIGDLTLQTPVLANFPTTHVGGAFTVPNSNLVVDGFSLALAGEKTFNTIEIKNGGVITSEMASELDPQLFSLTAQTIKIDATSKIDVSAKGLGFAEASGLGAGGSHGGSGGKSIDFNPYSEALPASTYGDIVHPESFGRGSKAMSLDYKGTYGGGAIKITANSLQLEGSILANGQSGAINQDDIFAGGAAGGSIWLNVGSLTSTNNSAKISADGGDGISSYLYLGGGGGGRIAIHYETLEGVENIAAKGGLNQSYATANGGSGTVYLNNKNNPSAREIRLVGSSTEGEYTNQNSLLSQGAAKVLIKNAKVELSGNPDLSNVSFVDSNILLSGGMSLTGALHVSGTILNVQGVAPVINGTVNIEDGSSVYFHSPTVFAGTVNAANSNLTFKEDGELNQYTAIDSNITFESNAKFSGESHLINSAVDILGDLQASGPVTLTFDTNNINIAVGNGGAAEEFLADDGHIKYISSNDDLTNRDSISFKIVRGLGDGTGVSFESVSQPGFFLSNAAAHLQLLAYDQSPESAQKATFYTRSSFNSDFSLFESMIAPGHFILRNLNNELVVESLAADSLADSRASWRVQKNNKMLNLNALFSLNVRGNAQFTAPVKGIGAYSPLLIVGDQLSMIDDNAIADGISLSLAKSQTLNNIELKNFGLLTTPAVSNDNPGLALIATNVSVEEGSEIDLSEIKSLYNYGSSAGGSHGGRGGNASSNVYGDLQQPITAGEPGSSDALGGGTFKLIAQSLNLNGEISADGGPATEYYGAAAGGSILLIVENMTSSSGTGKIHANGGSAIGSANGAGGGGRIALYGALAGIDDNNIVAKGGVQGFTPSQAGQDGTIYKNLGSVPPTVISNNLTELTNQHLQQLRVIFSAPIMVSSFTVEDITLIDANQNTFVPSEIVLISETEYEIRFSAALLDGVYTIKLGPDVLGYNGLKLDQNKNLIPGETGDVYTANFTVDTTAPSATVLETYPLVTGFGQYTFTGTKEAGSQVLVNGSVFAAANSATTWSHTFYLSDNTNTYSFVVKDQAGNYSLPTIASIIYDNSTPGPVNFTASGNGDGKQLSIDWSDYDVVANGDDISQYKIYVSSNNYTSINQLTPVQTVSRNSQFATVSGLNAGQQYYVSVVAYDYSGKFNSSVTPIAVTPVDTKAPSGLDNLLVVPGLNSLQLSWTPATDSDLAYYRVSYFENNLPKTITLSKVEVGTVNPVTYQLANLVPATAYNIVVSAVDDSGNTSAVLTDPGVTLINNPFDLKATPEDSQVVLIWSSIQPSSLIKHYAVYVQTTPFTSVAGLVPVLTTGILTGETSVSRRLYGLTNGTKIYVAVTTVNKSNGEIKTVQPIAVIPQGDLEGPVITEAKYVSGNTSFNLANSPTLTAAGRVAIKATDASRINRMAYTLDGESLGLVLVTGSSGGYEQVLNLLEITDGAHNLTVDAYDSLENVTHASYAFNVDYAAPSAPAFISPVANLVTNKTAMAIVGSAALGTSVILSNNGSPLPAVTTDSSGKFTAMVDLQEGANQLVAKAQYIGRSKWSSNSVSRTLTLNTQVPNVPAGLTAVATKQGQVLLNWGGVSSEDPTNQLKGYNLYRSAVNFTSATDAGVQKINAYLLSGNSFSDLVVLDGKYFYAVSAVNQSGNTSAISATVSATSDSQGPKIVQLTFVSDGVTDSVSGRMGKGSVKVSASFNEPLRNSPYFAVVPDKGVPITIELSKSFADEKLYTGQFQITESTPAGIAYVVMSAYDPVGNRGTDIEQNTSVKIDTHGPEVSELLISPAAPLKVDEVNGLAVSVSIKLNDDTYQNQMPKLVPLLDGVVVAGYSEGITLVRDINSAAATPLWTGAFTLPSTAARTAEANLSFSYLAEDDLGNSTSKIFGLNQFQVYQGDLPPLSVPNNLVAKAQPKGKVKLSWQAIEDAVSYVIYRQGPTDSSLIALDPVTATEFIDQTAVDGTYLYAIASVRSENGQESRSAKSASVSVKADSVAPAAPQSFALELNGAGLVSRWVAPIVDVLGGAQVQEGLSYNLYRLALSQGQQVADITAMTPIQTAIPALIALDTKPSLTEHSYFVTAVDAAGNVSPPSATSYLNFGLLPVNQLHVALANNGYPTLTWQHNGTGIQSYRVSRRTGNEAPVLLTPEAINHIATTTVYTDTTYNGNQASKGADQEVIYSVVAVDNNNVESLPHELKLPAISVAVEKTKDMVMERGIMNQVMFRVVNKGATSAQRLRLYVNLVENGITKSHQSEYFDVAAGADTLVAVVIGGYSKLDGTTNFTMRLEQLPQTNESINVTELETIQVGSSNLTMSLNTEDFIRGGAGKVFFTVNNTSDVETELVLATSNGTADSNEVRLVLEDLQGNVLTQLPIKQFTGGVIAVNGGSMVARIAPKGSFTSATFNINVPVAAPDQVKLRLQVDKYHYHTGQATQVEMVGVGVTKDLQLSDTPYYAEVDSIAPGIIYAKGETVTVTGHAKVRGTGQPMANVPVTVAYSVRGFEVKPSVYSDETGKFTFVYKSDGTPGRYRVSAVHPDVTDRPNQGEFIVEGGSVDPKDITVKIPRNYPQKISYRIAAGYESTLNNVRLTLVPSGTSEAAQLPAGVAVSFDPIARINANTYQFLNVTFSGDNSAVDKGSVSYRLEADNHTGAKALGVVNINYTLMQASPAIAAKPNYIDSGVGLDKEVIEDMLISNAGLDVLRNASIELTSLNGSPLPSWVRLNTSASLGDLAIGESRNIQVIAKPLAGTAEGEYLFKLKIKGDNLSVTTRDVLFKVTQSGIGKAFFHVSDIYTASLDKNGQRIDGVKSARIQLQNENVLSQVFNLDTDVRGEALFQNIPAGRYSYRISAFDHESVSGRVWVKPDVTTSEEVFAMNVLVNVEWSVREIAIEDRYEVKLDATFKTNVPAPVIVLSPLSVSLPVMKQGEVFQGEFTLTNYGAIRATEVKQFIPASTHLVRFEFLKPVPDTLEPGDVFTLPYRVVALSDFNPDSDSQATGGGCGSMNADYRVSGNGQCANGSSVSTQSAAKFNSNWGGIGCGGGTGQKGEVGGITGGAYAGSGESGVVVSKAVEPAPYCVLETECDDCKDNNGSAN